MHVFYACFILWLHFYFLPCFICAILVFTIYVCYEICFIRNDETNKLIPLTTTMKCTVHATVSYHERSSSGLSVYLGGNYPCSTPGFRLVLSFLTRIQPYEISFRPTGIAWCKTILQLHMYVSALNKIYSVAQWNRFCFVRDHFVQYYTWYYMVHIASWLRKINILITSYILSIFQLILVETIMLSMDAISYGFLISDLRCATIN